MPGENGGELNPQVVEVLNHLTYLIQIKDSSGDRVAAEVLIWARDCLASRGWQIENPSEEGFSSSDTDRY